MISAVVFTTYRLIHIVTSCIYLRIHHPSRIPYLFHNFSDFVVYVVTTLIFRHIRGNVLVFDKGGYSVSVVQVGHHRAQ